MTRRKVLAVAVLLSVIVGVGAVLYAVGGWVVVGLTYGIAGGAMAFMWAVDEVFDE